MVFAGGDPGGDGALHVAGAAAIEHAVADVAGKRAGAPIAVAGGNHVGMAGEADMRAGGADAGEQVFRLPVAQPGDGEAQRLQQLRQNILRAVIRRGDGGAADQCLGKGDGVGGQSRSNSLIEVLERVRSSTRLTITAQYSDGPGVPSGKGLPGSVPGTTTE